MGASGNALTQELTVVTLVDTLDELEEEQFSVRLRNETGAGARIGGKATAEATITDKDEPVLSIGDVTAQEDAGSIVFPVALSLPSALEITASYATTAGTATAGQDFTAASGTVRVAVGATAATITIALLDDTADEPNETFTVTLSSPSATAALAADPSATGTIIDNDGPPALSIDDATAEEGETSMVFTAKLDKASGSEVTASWSTADDTASAPADYTAVTGGSISIPAGSLSTELTVTLNVAENELDEPDKQFSVTLASLANAASGDLTATGTIADDDLPNVSLHARFVTIVEGANAQFELTRDGNLVVPLEVSLAVTQDGDFLAETAPTSASFDANAERLVVAVPTANDEVDEAAGSITLTVLSDTTYTIVAPASATVTVTDNDLPTLTVAAVDTEVTEGSSAEFRVTRAGNDHGAALDFQVFAAASDGYFVEASSVDGTIAAGSSSADVSVRIRDNVFVGEVGELTVAMSARRDAYRVGSPAQVTIDILDDDEAGTTPRLSVLNRDCFENTETQPCIVILQLDRAATAAFTVIVSTADGTARGSATGAGADFKHRSGKRVEFDVGDGDAKWLEPLVLTGDRTDEEDETFSVIVTLAAGTDPAAVTIAKARGP